MAPLPYIEGRAAAGPALLITAATAPAGRRRQPRDPDSAARQRSKAGTLCLVTTHSARACPGHAWQARVRGPRAHARTRLSLPNIAFGGRRPQARSGACNAPAPRRRPLLAGATAAFYPPQGCWAPRLHLPSACPCHPSPSSLVTFCRSGGCWRPQHNPLPCRPECAQLRVPSIIPRLACAPVWSGVPPLCNSLPPRRARPHGRAHSARARGQRAPHYASAVPPSFLFGLASSFRGCLLPRQSLFFVLACVQSRDAAAAFLFKHTAFPLSHRVQIPSFFILGLLRVLSH